jgi:hypothetical protein
MLWPWMMGSGPIGFNRYLTNLRQEQTSDHMTSGNAGKLRASENHCPTALWACCTDQTMRQSVSQSMG